MIKVLVFMSLMSFSSAQADPLRLLLDLVDRCVSAIRVERLGTSSDSIEREEALARSIEEEKKEVYGSLSREQIALILFYVRFSVQDWEEALAKKAERLSKGFLRDYLSGVILSRQEREFMIGNDLVAFHFGDDARGEDLNALIRYAASLNPREIEPPPKREGTHRMFDEFLESLTRAMGEEFVAQGGSERLWELYQLGEAWFIYVETRTDPRAVAMKRLTEELSERQRAMEERVQRRPN